MRTKISLISMCLFIVSIYAHDDSTRKYSLPVFDIEDEIYRYLLTNPLKENSFENGDVFPPILIFQDVNNEDCLINKEQKDSLYQYSLMISYNYHTAETIEGYFMPVYIVNSSEYHNFINNPPIEDSLKKVFLPVFILNNPNHFLAINQERDYMAKKISSPVFRITPRKKHIVHEIDYMIPQKTDERSFPGGIFIKNIDPDSLSVFTINDPNLLAVVDEFINKAEKGKYASPTQYNIYIELDDPNLSDIITFHIALRKQNEDYNPTMMYEISKNFQTFIKHRDVLFRTYIRSNSVTYNYHILDNFLELLPEKQAIYLKKPPTDFYKYDEKGGNPAEDIILESFYEKTYNYPSE